MAPVMQKRHRTEQRKRKRKRRGEETSIFHRLLRRKNLLARPCSKVAGTATATALGLPFNKHCPQCQDTARNNWSEKCSGVGCPTVTYFIRWKKKPNKDEEAPSAHKYFNGGEKQKHEMIDNIPHKKTDKADDTKSNNSTVWDSIRISVTS